MRPALALVVALCACGGAAVLTVEGLKGASAPPEELGVCVARSAPVVPASPGTSTGGLEQLLLGAWSGSQGDEHFVLEFFPDGLVSHTDVKRERRYFGSWSLRDAALRLQFADPQSAVETKLSIANGVMRLDCYPDAAFMPVSCERK